MLDIGEVSQYPSIAGSLHNEVEYCTECGKAYRIQAMIMVQVVRHNHAEVE
jgi:hypothetical protein